ncbi:MAG: CBS domain-containing protein [bacterium]
MLVKERLQKKENKIIALPPKAGVLEAMKAMIDHGVRCMPVVDDKGELLGIIDDKDIFRAAHNDNQGFKTLTVDSLMETDLIVGLPTDDINYIAGLMSKNNIHYVPIMDEGKMIGLISRSDVIRSQRRHIDIENRYLKLYMEGTQHG